MATRLGGDEGWSMEIDAEDAQTILFHFPRPEPRPWPTSLPPSGSSWVRAPITGPRSDTKFFPISAKPSAVPSAVRPSNPSPPNAPSGKKRPCFTLRPTATPRNPCPPVTPGTITTSPAWLRNRWPRGR
jgi:hypothetical protein